MFSTNKETNETIEMIEECVRRKIKLSEFKEKDFNFDFEDENI